MLFFMTFKRSDSGAFIRVGDVIGQLMASFKSESGDIMSRIWSLWPSAVGAQIAGNTRPTAYKGHTLYVNVESSPWMQELRFLKSDIIYKVNETLGTDAVRTIKFRVGPIG
jgi:hypothetical protein